MAHTLRFCEYRPVSGDDIGTLVAIVINDEPHYALVIEPKKEGAPPDFLYIGLSGEMNSRSFRVVRHERRSEEILVFPDAIIRPDYSTIRVSAAGSETIGALLLMDKTVLAIVAAVNDHNVGAFAVTDGRYVDAPNRPAWFKS